MKTFAIPENVATAILNYLSTRPYREVYELITALQQIQPVGQPAPVPPIPSPPSLDDDEQ